MTVKTSLRQAQLILALQDYSTALAFGPALAALLGSLYFSEVAGFEPCELCWFQRIFMYPLSVILLVGIFSPQPSLPKFVLPLSVPGLLVASYHILVENNVVGSVICETGVSCAVKYVNYFGFLTIPTLAWLAFALITGLMLGLAWANRFEVQEEDA